MLDQARISTLLTQYKILCRYCDNFFEAVQQEFRPHIQCAKGCASCCILETVVPLEAFVIASYLKTAPPIVSPAREPLDQTCVFLHNSECAIYPVRPIICRTHGLPILYPERNEVDACPLNFQNADIRLIDPRFFFNAEQVTANLLRLNLAFCLLTERPKTAGDRIPLCAISSL